MPQSMPHIRHGFGAVRPYLHGPLDLPSFVCNVFGAVVLERHEFNPQKAHVELELSGSVLVIEAGKLPSMAKAWESAVYVYVPDVDEVYAKALELGAISVAPPEDKPYQERSCGFRDVAGNVWWVSTFQL
jgi:PhnB protein